MANQRVRASEVVGVPFVPPSSATRATNRVRSWFGRVHRSLAPPPLAIVEGLFGMLDHRVLVALCDAGVPEALDGPADVDELARRTASDPDRLWRLIRYAATRGWVRIDRRGRVRPTRVTRFLRRDHPGGWRAWVDFAGGDDVVGSVARLGAAAGNDPFTAANGSPFFDWMAAHPDRWAAFDAAMAAGGRLHALGLAAAVRWDDARRVCDIGGGTGALLATLLDRHGHLEGTVFDLPAVVSRAVTHPRLTARAGDMFDAVPADHDTYLLVNVVHDWGDDEVRRIFAAVATAAADRGARLLVVESEHTTVPRPDVATATDVLMAALTTGGRERTTDHIARLAEQAGLAHTRTDHLASGDLVHQFEM